MSTLKAVSRVGPRSQVPQYRPWINSSYYTILFVFRGNKMNFMQIIRILYIFDERLSDVFAAFN